nr:hypothetical protein [Pseudomonas prosekii]
MFQRRYTYDANGNLAGIDDSRRGTLAKANETSGVEAEKGAKGK